MDLPSASHSRPEPGGVTIVRAQTAQAADAVRLIEEYQHAVDVVVRDSAAEIIESVDAPDKAIWLAYIGDSPVGCIAMRWLSREQGRAEIKRLYVQPAFRSRQIAQRLVAALEAFAIEQGCSELYLDSKDDLQAATRLYARLGYALCPRYNDNPQATIFMRKNIDALESAPLVLRPFTPQDAEAFRALNEAWITTLFRMEASDHVVLNDPIGQIIQTGGFIFMAVRGDRNVGCCALVVMGDGCFELSKMAVNARERGRGVGRALLEYVVKEARKLRIRRLYLETNSSLRNAIHLYESIGFRHLPRERRGAAHYERGDVAMELFLSSQYP